MPKSAWPNRDKNEVSTLGILGDPSQLNGALDLQDYAKEQLEKALYDMTLIRVVEEVIAEMVVAGDVKCPAHLTIGQEATAVGIAANLRKSDRAFGCHRSHGHYLSMGGSLQGIMDEVLGKATGCSKGMGGSMHLTAKDVGFYGSVPIVAGTVPLAVGAGLAAKKDGNGDIGVAFFGDGACEEGVVHESLNAAATLDIPVLFVVENNLFSSHMDIHLRQPTDRTARFAEGCGVTAVSVDGNDVVQMMDVVGTLIEDMRANPKPVFVEAITYRWRGHVGPNEDIDVGIRRSTQELNEWKGRDPIRRLVDAMVAKGMMAEADFRALEQKVRAEVDVARDNAYKAPYPEESLLLEAVYATR